MTCIIKRTFKVFNGYGFDRKRIRTPTLFIRKLNRSFSRHENNVERSYTVLKQECQQNTHQKKKKRL